MKNAKVKYAWARSLLSTTSRTVTKNYIIGSSRAFDLAPPPIKAPIYVPTPAILSDFYALSKDKKAVEMRSKKVKKQGSYGKTPAFA